MFAKRFELAGRHIVAETFDSDVILLDVARGLYFSFTDSAALVWQAISAGAAPGDLLDAGARFEAADLEAYVEKLVTDGLLVVTDKAPEPVPAELAAQLVTTTEALELFVFDDLADLFLADPVHDTDVEAGWPVLQKTP